MYTHSEPVPNRTHKKSTKGCRACKLRRVKYDEKHPVCGKCAIHFDNITSCDWTPKPSTRGSKKSDRDSLRVLAPKKQVLAARTLSTASATSGVIDPFNSLPGSHTSDASVHSLIYHWVKIIALQQTSIGSQYCTNQTWLTAAISKPVLFNVTLYVTSLHVGAISLGKKEIVESLFYRSETVRSLNSALQDPNRAISDETIAAILLMLHVVRLIGDRNEVDTHISGLKQLFKMRGGIQKLADGGGAVLHMLCTTNHLTAVISETNPLLPDHGSTYAKTRRSSGGSSSSSSSSSPLKNGGSIISDDRTPTSSSTSSTKTTTTTTTTSIPSPLKDFAVEIGFHTTMVELLDDMDYLASVVDVFITRYQKGYRQKFEDIASRLEKKSVS